MIKSMTGYGKGEVPYAGGKIVVEIRCVNHRYGEITVKLPRQLLRFEGELKKRVGQQLLRGKIDVFIQLEGGSVAGAPVLNLPLAIGYYKALNSIREALGIGDPVSLALIASQKDVISLTTETEAAPEVMPQELVESLEQALSRVEEMRKFEGLSLYADFLKRRAILDDLIARVAERAPGVVGECTLRLKERVSLLLSEGALPDERIAVEVAVLADKCDVTEELVRLESHLRQFDETVSRPEPVGRKLDFLLQEINREVNTIGSKANDAQIAALVVELKAELEKIREQVQNVE